MVAALRDVATLRASGLSGLAKIGALVHESSYVDEGAVVRAGTRFGTGFADFDQDGALDPLPQRRTVEIDMRAQRRSALGASGERARKIDKHRARAGLHLESLAVGRDGIVHPTGGRPARTRGVSSCGPAPMTGAVTVDAWARNPGASGAAPSTEEPWRASGCRGPAPGCPPAGRSSKTKRTGR